MNLKVTLATLVGLLAAAALVFFAFERELAGAWFTFGVHPEVTGLLERTPDHLGFTEIGDDIDMRDTARFRPRWRFCRPAMHRRSHGHSRNLSRKQKIRISACGRPLQINVNKG